MSKKVTLSIDGMRCQGCASAVASALVGVSGVESAEVSLEATSAQLEVDETVDGEALISAVATAGYAATIVD